jgi:hypothetical protein
MNQNLMIALISLPLFAGLLGVLLSTTLVYLIFRPLTFRGITLPGVRAARAHLPRRWRASPLLSTDDRLGWQGLVPFRAAHIVNVALDRGLIDLDGLAGVGREVAPEQVAARVAVLARAELHDAVELIAGEDHGAVWHDLPPVTRRAVHERVARGVPAVIADVTAGIDGSLDEFVDPRALLTRRLAGRPDLLNRVFLIVRDGELRALQNFGCFLGLPLGFALFGLLQVYTASWTIVLGFLMVGLTETALILAMLLSPLRPRRWLPWRQGLLIRRRAECGEELVAALAEEVFTVDGIGEELLAGAHSDRVRERLHAALRPGVERAVRSARAAARVAVGTREFEQLRHAAVPVTTLGPRPYRLDPSAEQRCRGRVREVSEAAVADAAPAAFADLLRTAIGRERWLLLTYGAVIGLVTGLVHITLLGAVR